MPIYDDGERSVLFVHVPKTGGTSIKQAFSDAGYDRFLFGVGARRKSRGRGRDHFYFRMNPQHMHADLLSELVDVNQFTVAFMLVRDPIQRFRSEYAWHHRKSAASKPSPRRVERFFLKRSGLYKTNPFVSDNHFRPQCDFLLPGTSWFQVEDGIDKIVENLNKFHHLGLSLGATDRQKDSRTRELSSGQVPISRFLALRLIWFYRKDYRAFRYSIWSSFTHRNQSHS